MFFRKLTFCLLDTSITPRSSHLPLKGFLQKIALNAKVINWGAELSDTTLNSN